MLSVVFIYFGVVIVSGEIRNMTPPVFSPPSQEKIYNIYFRNTNINEPNNSFKFTPNISDQYYKTIEVMKKNLTANIKNLEQKVNYTHDDGVADLSDAIQEYIKTGVFKNIWPSASETTTYKYPTALWSSKTYERLKAVRRNRPRPKSHFNRPFINPAYTNLGDDSSFQISEKGQRKTRGKFKWKDTHSLEDNEAQYVAEAKKNESESIDKFLEKSLKKYLDSSNLKNTVGNVSVKTFSEALKNVTDQKPKRLLSPYDENKELRMRFREEVILKKKNETRQQGKFLEKQLQKRLEKVQDVFNVKDKDKILANMWKYTPLNRSLEVFDEKKSQATEDVLPILVLDTENSFSQNSSGITISTTKASYTRPSLQRIRGTVKYNHTWYATTENSYAEVTNEGYRRNLLKLTAEESSYYRRGQFPTLTFIGHPGKCISGSLYLKIITNESIRYLI